ncbi:MAG: IS630 family transposase [Pseudonocardiaceae bacterium]
MGLRPHRMESFKFSTDPELEAKITDVVGLYLHPPENVVVLCVDEKSQVQALERAQPMLPLAPRLAARRSYDYYRHGTTSLFAALEIATGKVLSECYPRHTNVEFLAFLKLVARQYPEGELCIVMDSYSTHTRQNVRAWLDKLANK